MQRLEFWRWVNNLDGGAMDDETDVMDFNFEAIHYDCMALDFEWGVNVIWW